MEKESLFKKESMRWLIIALPFIFLAIFWNDLPERLPLHWNLDGNPDRYGNKISLLGLAAINIVLYGLFLGLPYLDPKRKNYAVFNQNWHIMQIMIHVFMSFVFFLVGLTALGYNLNVGMVVKYGVIILFLVLGNYLGTIRRNYFIGIKNPWTLSSDFVWNKTHRFTAQLWVYASVFMLIFSFWENEHKWVFFIYIGLLALVPFGYSYIIYRQKPIQHPEE